jgi:electron transfer flavoprotein alpha/beta subunit
VIVLVCVEPVGLSAASRAALQVACDAGPSVRVVVASAGSAQQFRKSSTLVSPGPVERILRLQESALGEANCDTTAMLLAEIARHVKAQVVLAGEQSGAEGQGLVAAAIANHLHAPYVAGAAAIATTNPPDRVQVTVRSGGRRCKVISPGPVVAATPALGRTTEAPEAEGTLPKVEILSLADLEVDASRLVRRPDLRGTLVSTPGQVVHNTTFEQAARLLLRR